MFAAVYVIPSTSTGPMTESSSRSIDRVDHQHPVHRPERGELGAHGVEDRADVSKLGDTAVCSQLSPIRNCR